MKDSGAGCQMTKEEDGNMQTNLFDQIKTSYKDKEENQKKILQDVQNKEDRKEKIRSELNRQISEGLEVIDDSVAKGNLEEEFNESELAEIEKKTKNAKKGKFSFFKRKNIESEEEESVNIQPEEKKESYQFESKDTDENFVLEF